MRKCVHVLQVLTVGLFMLFFFISDGFTASQRTLPGSVDGDPLFRAGAQSVRTAINACVKAEARRNDQCKAEWAQCHYAAFERWRNNESTDEEAEADVGMCRNVKDTCIRISRDRYNDCIAGS